MGSANWPRHKRSTTWHLQWTLDNPDILTFDSEKQSQASTFDIRKYYVKFYFSWHRGTQFIAQKKIKGHFFSQTLLPFLQGTF